MSFQAYGHRKISLPVLSITNDVPFFRSYEAKTSHTSVPSLLILLRTPRHRFFSTSGYFCPILHGRGIKALDNAAPFAVSRAPQPMACER
ncbi:hypothetical protein DPEC_G00076650 [Dallia pectoralis]|uniref:Uncharacterized protein n=1 Tax=Dallia pectoralis TaxID=75939 RepID=A0ACC2H4A8_DALPE|nr:hypothetical protein DPEC_G00076650 [Dallia pectoralis]